MPVVLAVSSKAIPRAGVAARPYTELGYGLNQNSMQGGPLSTLALTWICRTSGGKLLTDCRF